MTSMSARAAAALAAAVLTAAASAAPANPAAAGTAATTGIRQELSTSFLSADDQARIDQQRPLVKAASLIRWEIERHPYADYTNLVLEESQVALYWKGAVPPAMTKVIKNASRTAPIDIRHAEYSLSELRAAAVRLRKAQPTADSVKFQPDGSGLILGTTVTGLKAATSTAGVPVTVVKEAQLQPVSRDDDWAPWKGGATFVDTNQGTACTTGFGVRSGGASYILTAAHCGQVGDRIQDAGGEFIGNVGARHQDHDVELIPTSSVDGYVYVGTPNDNIVGLVEGWDWTFTGEYLCQSGVTSSRELGRPVCNLKVLFYYDDVQDLVEAEQTEGQTAARPGDSGGPVYSISASGKLVAKGTTTRVAGARLGFQDYGTAWRDFGGITPATR